MPGLVRSDETTAEIHPVARPESDRRPMCVATVTATIGVRRPRFPRFASPAIETGLGKSFGVKAALARLDPMVPCAVESGPLQTGSLMLTDFLRRLSGRLLVSRS